ncbi:hypothetical protein [Tardiphaga sp. 619_E2_N8_5]|uniref:hypothetical protein n=1 Tax=unclassified Tardiphaga TaxID=2631404 RepID=UPI003F277DC3
MSDLNPKSLGRLALGGFFVAFADVEMRIGEVLKSLLKAEGPHQDLILAAIGNFAAKTNAIKAGLDNATSYGSQPGTQDRPKLEQPVVEMARKAMSKALALNEMRVKLAHGHLAQMDDGSFVVTHLKIQDGRLKKDRYEFSVQALEDKCTEREGWAPGTSEIRRRLASTVILLPAIRLNLSTGQLRGVASVGSAEPFGLL